MSSAPNSALALVGLVGTGKTNFLVALDVVLDDQADPNGLVHSEFADDRAYLQPLKEQWLRGQELERTDRQTPPPHQLLVRHPKSGATAGFHIPDLAGETFDGQFETRSFSPEFVTRLERTAGLLLFLHARHEADHVLLESPIFLDPAPTGTAAPAPADPVREWSIKDACRQVKLVDLLQFIGQIRPPQNPLRVAVVLSAWDLVESAPKAAASDLPKDPHRFLTTRWPLLDQYLRSQEDLFSFRVYGVSARGGGTSEAEILRLTSVARPSERIVVQDGTHRSQDLSRPVKWLLGIDDNAA
jgi:hypothetical protein